MHTGTHDLIREESVACVFEHVSLSAKFISFAHKRLGLVGHLGLGCMLLSNTLRVSEEGDLTSSKLVVCL